MSKGKEETERGPVVVEVIMRDREAEKKTGGRRLLAASGVGLFGAMLSGVIASIAGSRFLTWYRTPSLEEDSARAHCAKVVQDAVGGTLNDFIALQAAAVLGGFVLLFLFAWLKLRRTDA